MKKKKVAIWGAGLYGGRLSVGLGRGNVDIFIDRNPWRDYYAGHPVVHPDTISDEEWAHYFVYVPFNYYDEIKEFLEKKGLNKGNDFVVYSSKLKISQDVAENDFSRYKEELAGVTGWDNRIVIWGRFWQKKEYLEYIELLRKNGIKLALISEAIWFNSEETEKLVGIPSLTAPVFADEETLIDADYTYGKLLFEGMGLFEAEVEHLAAVHKDAAIVAVRRTVDALYQYISYTIEKLGIKEIICLCSMLVHHEILQEICKEHNIRVIFSHQGVLPGTLSFDSTGEMGESVPAIYDKKFSRLPITEENRDDVKQVIEKLCESAANRKPQPKTDWVKQVKKIQMVERPTILYLGQNDVHSRMIPYMDKTKDRISPIFDTTGAALLYLAEVCNKNRWNLIYKPHPMYVEAIEESQMPENVIYVPFGNINEMIDYSDVVVTILSSSNYISLIRNKPVVMLGYNQTRGKGCTYEAFEKDKIEETIKEALEKGYTPEQKEAFTKHVAQLLKYYLYDDMQPRDLRYGKPVPKNFDEFYELERILVD